MLSSSTFLTLDGVMSDAHEWPPAYAKRVVTSARGPLDWQGASYLAYWPVRRDDG